MTIVIFKTKKNDFLKWKAAHRWQFCLDEKKWEKIMYLLNMLKCRRKHFCYWKYQEGLYAIFDISTFLTKKCVSHFWAPLFDIKTHIWHTLKSGKSRGISVLKWQKKTLKWSFWLLRSDYKLFFQIKKMMSFLWDLE